MMKTSAILLLLSLFQVVNGFAPLLVRPAQRPALAMATAGMDADGTVKGERKRDKVMKVIQNITGRRKAKEEKKSASPAAAEPAQPAVAKVQKIHQEAQPKRQMMKLTNGKKYENIDCLEEKAFQILKDLNMIEEHN